MAEEEVTGTQFPTFHRKLSVSGGIVGLFI